MSGTGIPTYKDLELTLKRQREEFYKLEEAFQELSRDRDDLFLRLQKDQS